MGRFFIARLTEDVWRGSPWGLHQGTVGWGGEGDFSPLRGIQPPWQLAAWYGVWMDPSGTSPRSPPPPHLLPPLSPFVLARSRVPLCQREQSPACSVYGGVILATHKGCLCGPQALRGAPPPSLSHCAALIDMGHQGLSATPSPNKISPRLIVSIDRPIFQASSASSLLSLTT